MSADIATSLPVSSAVEPVDEQPLAEDLLVEEVSIDGMCGVY